ncbi:hypothetical protein PHLCEN_2v4298 [Hermanssonia centrifuga]|uniref:NCS cytosine-purine permease n=1 Tax=Hermanssonia centrifuga TaxID=98765 RepID=A0A2R6PVN8_9APHY|nr:hypothetical protein PHLCEN_2v4298 [Hermanssonia centrifuga]
MSYNVDFETGTHPDVEKDLQSISERNHDDFQYSHPFKQKLLSWGVEARGILPVPPELRTDTQYNQIFFIWLSANFNILSFSAGTLGPVVFGLGLRDTCLVILFFNLVCSALPAYLTTWGPKLGLRQMCQSRYSFGFFGVIIPSIFNLASMCGFCILNCILGGQTLSSVSGGGLSWTVGIVIISVISLLVSFCGYKVLTWYERLAWIPVLVVYVVALGIGGKHLLNPPPAEPASAIAILSFASTIAGFVITYSPLASDFTIYFPPEVDSIIPLSIVGSTKFYDTLTNFLGLIGYWASAYGAVILMEHLVIRRGRFDAYDLRYWNSPRKLPTGLAALGACAIACALIVPSMDQVWFLGPIAEKTGDIGFEMAFTVTAIAYVPLRYFELRFRELV